MNRRIEVSRLSGARVSRRTWAALWLLLAPAWCFALEVEVQGVPEGMVERVRDSIVVDTSDQEETVDRRDAQRLVDRGRQQLKRAMTAFGFYRARVTAELTGDPSQWKAVYVVEPGEPVRYESVRLDVTGAAASESSLQEYIDGEPLKAGDRVEHDRYEAVKQELLKRTNALGYLDAGLSAHRVEIDMESYRADAVIVVDSGPLYKFGDIRLEQDVLNDEYLRGFVAIERGARYSDQRLLKLEQDLRDSNYFSEIRVDPRIEEAGADGYVPVDVTLSPREPNEYQAGLGFGTDTGIRGSLGWQNHRINRRGHRLGSSAELSQIGGSVEGRYTIPFGDPRREQYDIFVDYSEDDPETSESEIGRIGIRRSTILTNRLRLDLSFTYQREDFTVADQSGLTDLFIPAIGLSWVKADNRLFTRNGLRWNASLQGAGDIISDFAFLQPHGSAKLIRSLGDFRLILRGEAAMTAADLDDLPASLRFFAGGDQSVRGYEYESLGPTNVEGDVTGGRQLLVGSVEIDYGISDKWRVAAFVDAGNAFDDFENREPLRQSAGIGVRRITPIGPVRVDLAYPIDDDDESFRLHVTIGPDL